mgnify:CR=1 FL=1
MPTSTCPRRLPSPWQSGLLLLFLSTASAAFAAPPALTVVGTVVNARGEGLPGVNVLEKNTRNGTTTDATGRYRLTVADGAVLLFSSVGYLPQEIAVGNRTDVNVTLQDDSRALDEVVVVGYGAQRRRDVTGAVASVSAERIRELPVASLDRALAGQVAGVQVQQATGTPGGGVTVRVRGTGSISAGNEPLYVIDGFPVEANYSQAQNPLATINPGDIESIEILKDASATAIYGSRGSNGVVIITTKRGKAGKPTLSFETYVGWQNLLNKMDVMNAREFAEFHIEGRNNGWLDANPARNKPTDPNDVRTDPLFKILPDLLNPAALGEGTDWQDEIYRVAPIQNYQLSLSGGTESTRYAVSGGYFDQRGILINTGFKRYALRLNLDSDVSRRLRLGVSFAPSFTKSDQVTAEGSRASGVVQTAIAYSPHYPVYNPDGTYTTAIGNGDVFGTGFVLANLENPVAMARERTDVRNQIRLLGNAYAEFEVLTGLNLKVLVGSDLFTNRRDFFSPSIVGRENVKAPVAPTATSETNQRVNWLNENTLTYQRVFGQRHNLTALVGYTIQKEIFDSNDLDATNFPTDAVPTLNAGFVTRGSSFRTEWSLISYLGRVNYAFDDRYLLTATLRRDGSSRFGAGNKWGVFPSVSVGWRVAGENFMKSVAFVTDLKLRGSYGLAGNNSIPNYGSIGLIQAQNYVTGAGLGAVVNGLALQNIANDRLSWETMTQGDVGLDASLFNNRVSVVIDYYNKINSNLLLNVPVPQSTGFSTSLVNIGKVRNRGWEFTLGLRNRAGKLGWNTDFNLSTNRNVVLALGPSGDPILVGAGAANSHITQIGSPIASFFGYQLLGIFNSEEEIKANPTWGGSRPSRPGDARFADINGDGNVLPNDRTIIGNWVPKFTYGLTSRFTYGPLDFSFIIQGVQGNQVFNLSRFQQFGNTTVNQLRYVQNRWQSPTQPGNGMVMRYNIRNTGGNNDLSSFFVEDGSFFRLNNVTLGYSLPAGLTKKLALQSARVYGSVQNAFMLTKYLGYNPEVSTSGTDPLRAGTDFGGYPLARTVMLGLNLNF